MNTPEDNARSAVDEINTRIDYLRRLYIDAAGRYEQASAEGAELAHQVNRYLADPEAYGTADLRVAYQRFMGRHSANFAPAEQ
jgi:hypothetical protein